MNHHWHPLTKPWDRHQEKQRALSNSTLTLRAKALDVINEFEKLLGLHVIFSYYRYDWYADIREPVRRGCIFEPEDNQCFKGTLKELEANHKKSGAIPNCW